MTQRVTFPSSWSILLVTIARLLRDAAISRVAWASNGLAGVLTATLVAELGQVYNNGNLFNQIDDLLF